MPSKPAEPLKKAHYYALLALMFSITCGFIFFWQQKNASHFDQNIFLIAVAVGIFAQLVDGALGMAYGITSSTFMLTLGVPPATSSASVHIAKIFTGIASGLSHWQQGNINFKLFQKLLIPGSIGAVVGVFIVSSLDGNTIRPYISAYLLLMGLNIIRRAFDKHILSASFKKKNVSGIAMIGGFVDSIGGGGWGPVVTTSLIGSGHEPRTTIGSVNAAEFFVTITSGFSFALLVTISSWEPIAGLILGGIGAAPFAAVLTRKIPIKPLMIAVGILVSGLSTYSIIKALM